VTDVKVQERPSESLRAAMGSADIRVALYDTCRRLLAGGCERSLILAVLDELLEGYRWEGDHERESVVLEMMDVLEGGVSQHVLDRFFDALPAKSREGLS
jgi:hypothetical protein